MIVWAFYPKTDPAPQGLVDVVNIFQKHEQAIDSVSNDTNEARKKSDEVLAVLAPDLVDAGFRVETGKRKEQKIRVPVLFGQNGVELKSFEVDGWHVGRKIVVEIEAGRAYANNQFLKDIFETGMMVEVDYLALAVRKSYKGKNDFEEIAKWLEILYATNRITLDLKGILLIGY